MIVGMLGEPRYGNSEVWKSIRKNAEIHGVFEW